MILPSIKVDGGIRFIKSTLNSRHKNGLVVMMTMLKLKVMNYFVDPLKPKPNELEVMETCAKVGGYKLMKLEKSKFIRLT